MPAPRAISRDVFRIGLLTLLWPAWCVLVARLTDVQPEPVIEVVRLELDIVYLGHLVVMAGMPLALFYAFCRSAAFQRALAGQPRPQDRWPIHFGFTLVLAGTFVAVFVIDPTGGELGTLGIPMLLLIGLFGGRRRAFVLGLAACAMVGVWAFSLHPHHDLVPLLRLERVPEPEDLPRALEVIITCILFEPAAMSYLWAGTLAGPAASVLHPRRFTLLPTFFLGAVVEAYAFAAVLAQPISPLLKVLQMILAPALVSGATLAAGALMAASAQRESAQRRAEAAELALARADLEMLRAQINPHFLFNALNTIRYFVRTRPETARQLLLRLSQCFQRLLRQGDLIPFEDELGYLAAYLELEKARFGDRLEVELPRPGPPVLAWPVPTLVLQPLVENAIRHGVGPKATGGTVAVTAEVEGARLRLAVRDDGVGMNRCPSAAGQRLSSETLHHGIGLANLEARLRALYGDEAELAIESEEGRGTSVVVHVPATAALARTAPHSEGRR